MMMLFVNYITPPTPIYEGAFVKEGLNLAIGISGFVEEDRSGEIFDEREVVKVDAAVETVMDGVSTIRPAGGIMIPLTTITPFPSGGHTSKEV